MKNEYSGMTVNERLYLGGMFDSFYDAVERKDIVKVILILKEVELNDVSIKAILESNGLKSDDQI